MSQRNGDKARFHRMRKKAIVRRERQQILLAGAHKGPKDGGSGKGSPGKQPVKPAPSQ